MKYVFLCLASAVMVACNVSESKEQKQNEAGTGSTIAEASPAAVGDSARSTTIEWLDPVVQDLGKMDKGQIAEITWRFKNTGSQPLYITNVRAGCGCTTPDVPKEPIAPGSENVIKAKFNSQNFEGHVTKEVFVEANNSNRNNGNDNKLSFSADIK